MMQLRSFEKAIDLDPESGESYYYLGELYRVTKQHKIASIKL